MDLIVITMPEKSGKIHTHIHAKRNTPKTKTKTRQKNRKQEPEKIRQKGVGGEKKNRNFTFGV